MALTQIDFDDIEEKKIEEYAKKWHDMNKPKTIRKMIAEFEDKNGKK